MTDIPEWTNEGQTVFTVNALQGKAACDRAACFGREIKLINGAKPPIPYSPWGPNSNTLARALLARCGVPQVKPWVWALGWNDPLTY